MTPPSADRRLLVPAAPGGFTLLEIMLTLAIVAMAATTMLTVRGQASNTAWKTGNYLKALRYAEELLSDAILSTELHQEATGIVEEDPDFRWTLTVEEFDLATGRTRDEAQTTLAGGFTTEVESAFVPNDAGGMEEDEPGPHLVRRVEIIITFPGREEDRTEELSLENYVPLITEDDEYTNFGGYR